MKNDDSSLERLIFSQPDLDVKQLNAFLNKQYSIKAFIGDKKDIGLGADDPRDAQIAIIQRRYDDSQLDILEDIYVNDYTACECVQKKSHFIMGKHARTVLDIKKEFRKEEDRRKAIEAINNQPNFITAKGDIDKLLYDTDLYQMLTDGCNSAFTYGRAAIQKIYNQVPLEQSQEDIDAGEPVRYVPGNDLTGFKLLNSKRLGRIKVDKISGQVISVEYYDMQKIGPDGLMVEAAEDEKFIPIGELIYLVNKDGNVSTNAQYTGVSRLESVVHASQIKRIIINKNVKEAAYTHYAGILFAKFPEDVDENIIINWIANAAKAAGRWIAHKLNVEISHFKVDTDLDKYSGLVELLDRAIIRAIGIPSFLVGYEQIANYANSEQVLIAWREGELQFWRNWLKDNLQKYLLGPLFQSKAATNGKIQVLEKEKEKEKEEPEEPQVEPPTPGPVTEREPPHLMEIEASDVKLTYEFQDISFSTRKEVAEVLKLLSDIGVPLTDEMVLRVAGLDEWVEQISQEKEKKELKKAEEARKRIEELRANGQLFQQGQGQGQGPEETGAANQIPMRMNPMIGQASDINYMINQKKLKVLNLLEETIKGLQ